MTTCAHIWPDELTPNASCCGLPYGEWSQEDERD